MNHDSARLQEAEQGGVDHEQGETSGPQLRSKENAAILRRHLAGRVAVSDLAEEYGIQLSLLYQWQRQLLDNAAVALQPSGRTDRRQMRFQERGETLEAKLQKRDSVIAEISEEYVAQEQCTGSAGT